MEIRLIKKISLKHSKELSFAREEKRISNQTRRYKQFSKNTLKEIVHLTFLDVLRTSKKGKTGRARSDTAFMTYM